MTSARERAVEAGARAIAPHALMEDSPALKSARADAAASLRAAFPILAEEVLDIAATYLKGQYGASYGLDHPVDRDRLRARIQQMAEAL